jgi:hypothetical protein
MTQFTTEELNLITLYDPGNRAGTIYELRDMTHYLMPDENDLLKLTQGVIAKLEGMTDEEFDALADEMVPEYLSGFWDEDSANSTYSHLWMDEVDPDAEIE